MLLLCAASRVFSTSDYNIIRAEFDLVGISGFKIIRVCWGHWLGRVISGHYTCFCGVYFRAPFEAHGSKLLKASYRTVKIVISTKFVLLCRKTICFEDFNSVHWISGTCLVFGTFCQIILGNFFLALNSLVWVASENDNVFTWVVFFFMFLAADFGLLFYCIHSYRCRSLIGNLDQHLH